MADKKYDPDEFFGRKQMPAANLLAELQKCAESRCDECKDADCEHIGCKDARLFMAIDAIKALLQNVEINIFDEEEVHTNCTVQILRNSITGDVSVGWWENAD